MNSDAQIAAAVAAIRAGGVIAYPTEAVYGVGCDPFNSEAVVHLFALKERPSDVGVLLIAADFPQVEPFIDAPTDAVARAKAGWPGPQTWVFPRSRATPAWLTGSHTGIALRVTAHPVASALCRAFGGALVSTSANRHGEAPARNAAEARAIFRSGLAFVVEGDVGGLERPTPIRDAITGELLRA